MSDLYDIIQDSVDDATLPAEPTEAPEVSAAPDVPQDAPETVPDATGDTTSNEVGSPASRQDEAQAAKPDADEDGKPRDEFSKKYGLPATTESGRENRIPYSRVKKIVEKATKEREESLRKELDFGKSPQFAEFDAKVKDYEGRLAKVAEFEQVMVNDPEQFLTLLNKIPVYNQIFSSLTSATPAAAATSGTVAQQQATNGMPQPNEELADGTMVYNQEGLQALLDWQGKQIEDRVTKQVESRYKPIEDEWQAHQYMNKLVPQIQAQIEDARKWPLFKDNEADITKALQADQRLSLEGAYRQVVWPRMTTDRNKIREEVLAEIKKAPTSTSAPSRNTKPSSSPSSSSSGNALEDIIAASVANLPR